MENENLKKKDLGAKIIFFIAGLLLGAVISTGSIYFYALAANDGASSQQGQQMPGGTPPEMPSNSQAPSAQTPSGQPTPPSQQSQQTN